MGVQGATLRINPGGMLTPAEVVGRDSFVADTWQALGRQSVLLTAERRMGKTSVLLKLEAEPRPGACVIKRTLQGIRSPEEFVRKLIADVEKTNPGLLKRSIGTRLAEAGIKKIGSSPLSVEFSPAAERSWKDVVDEVLVALDQDVDDLVVLLWDELPQMIADIRDEHDALVAREMLDVLRAARESRSGIRMVLSGSLGIHHVVAELRAKGGMWVPTHDMRAVDLPPLREDDAVYLGRELLRNEGIACEDLDAVAGEMALEADCIPYYIHQTALQLQNLQQREGRATTIDAATVHEVVEGAIHDSLDPWELGHYVARTPIYYGTEAELVNTILDVLARAPGPIGVEAIHQRLAALGPPPSPGRLRELLELLCKDYYLRSQSVRSQSGYCFLRGLVRRAWLAKRPSA
jgi:hypothetical protein